MSLFIRRARSVLADLIDFVVTPFDYQVNALVDCGLPGISSFTVVQRPAGLPRARRLKPRR